ncbi:hypothetical protein N665_0055s0040 [Sinapis alba]|nr:hypothetical protein N665_0055s0040 [Sinapis alba]
MGKIIGVINAIWARSGPRIFVHNIGHGTYLLKVTSENTMGHLLSRQAWMIAGCHMFLAPWSPEFSADQSQLTSAVVPVEFRGVPYLLFNRQSLSRIATAVGKPVSLAPETERKENFEVAKVWVRVDLLSKLPTKIISGFSDGRQHEILVSYPWLPKKCPKCAGFGHDHHLCPSEVSSGKSYDKPKESRPNPSAARSRSRDSKYRRQSRPSRSHRERERQIYKVKKQATDELNLTSDANSVAKSGMVEDSTVLNKDINDGSSTISELAGDCITHRIVVKDWAEEAERQEIVSRIESSETSAIPKQVVSIDRNMGSSTVHVFHEDGGSTSASLGGNKADTEAPFFLVSNRKSSRKATKA